MTPQRGSPSAPSLPLLANVVVPMAGYIAVEYDSAYSLSHDIPTTSRITVRVANRIYPDTGITSRLRRRSTAASTWNLCTPPPESLLDPATAYRYARDSSHPATEWQYRPMPGLFPSEEITLRCSTTVLGTAIPLDVGLTGPDTMGETLVWRGLAETDFLWYCNPYYRFVQKVWFSLSFRPDTVVRFDTLSSTTVYPYYPAIRNDTVTTGVKKRYVDVQARIAYGDSILRNYPIHLDGPVLIDSGGHSHGGARPMGRYRVRNTAGNGFDTLSTFTRNTDSTGVLKFGYLSSQFGGVERITARLVSDMTKFDTLSVKTRVPGLDSLPIGTNYVKVGGTCDHHGPRDDTQYQNCRDPDNNHWGTSTLVANIRTIADSFALRYPNYKLRINDMSVPLGGGFDIYARWIQDITPPTCRQSGFGHCTHREGNTGDISFDVINPQGTRVRLTDAQRLRLERIINSVSGAPVVHSDHFHVQ